MLKSMKSHISLNIYSFAGWFVLKVFLSIYEGSAAGMIFFISSVFAIIVWSFCVIGYVAEEFSSFRLKNEFVLENPLYNMVFIAGYLAHIAAIAVFLWVLFIKPN